MSASEKKQPGYLVGIDLGTTHTAVAYSRLDGSTKPSIERFPIEQLVAPGEVIARPLLPSVRYHPAIGELAEGDIRLPWPQAAVPGEQATAVTGELARALGAKTEGRLVTSAKSWLSHPTADRTADILPWGSGEAVNKVSPVAASAAYLAHLRAAWNSHFPTHPLEQQSLILTVPASFDEAARSLTVEAARLAGLAKVRLLEEPQAVCYDWLWRHDEHLKQQLKGIRLLLVCDIGGGTTDLTLIKVEAGKEQPRLTRIAVGDHLMLGGDNIDLTLAHLAERRLVKGDQRLRSAELSLLIEQSRSAKERLLSDNAPDHATITLLGSGSRLIGSARSTQLTRQEVEEVVLDGFFPTSSLTDYPDRKRSGVVEFGLPYVADPAVSKQIAAFLGRHVKDARDALNQPERPPAPDAVLFNGGLFQSSAISQRLLAILSSWCDQPIHQLDNPQPTLAVAHGAVAYGLSRRDNRLRIGGGSARSYFLLVEHGQAGEKQGVCLLPRGTEEGQEIQLSQRTFALRLGEPVRFHMVSSTEETAFKAGDLVTDIEDERFLSLPPLAVAFDQQQTDQTDQPHQQSQREMQVQLSVALSEIGTLKIECVAVDDPAQRWNVEFQLRSRVTLSGIEDGQTVHPRLSEACQRINLIYGAKSKAITPKAVKSIRADLEKLVGKRQQWETALLRELFGALLNGAKHRRRSADHERCWLSLIGFTLRPGFGDPLDDWRIEQLWRIYSQGIQFNNEAQNWTEWWTMWRRVAGGLDSGAQSTLFKEIAKYLSPAAARQKNIAQQIKKRGYDDMVRLAAVLERLPSEQKCELGGWLLKRLQKPSEPVQSWWAVGRIGARVPFHGSSHNVVPQTIAAGWLEQMLDYDWKKQLQIGFAATLISRMSGDRERDIEPALRARIIERLHQIKAPASWLAMVEQLTELDEADEKRIFGEALPPGLKLID